MKRVTFVFSLSLLGLLAPLTGCGMQPADDTTLGEPVDTDPEGLTSYCNDVITWDERWSSLAREVIALVNDRRTAGATCGDTSHPPAPALTFDLRMRCAARKHAKDMASHDAFDHKGSDGTRPWDREARAGYPYTWAGENIAAGYDGTPSTLVNAWMSSPGHCSNIMNKNFKNTGVGYFHAKSSTYKHYWTQTFGAQ